MDNQKVWFVTGASKGLGLSLVKQLLKEGFKVAATSRKINELTDAVGVDGPNFLPLVLDLQNEDSVAAAIAAGIDRFGKIDVVVNNAGYGLTGSLEELSDEEARANFDVNVFGSLNVIRKGNASFQGTAFRTYLQYRFHRWIHRRISWLWYLLRHKIRSSRFLRIPCCGGEAIWRTCDGGLPWIFQNKLSFSRLFADTGK
jgi:NAD(P)-dependent dehydrogenase (short-subunit alcohol dehydrogenase family)